jgi:hypothetical protein
VFTVRSVVFLKTTCESEEINAEKFTFHSSLNRACSWSSVVKPTPPGTRESVPLGRYRSLGSKRHTSWGNLEVPAQKLYKHFLSVPSDTIHETIASSDAADGGIVEFTPKEILVLRRYLNKTQARRRIGRMLCVCAPNCHTDAVRRRRNIRRLCSVSTRRR